MFVPIPEVEKVSLRLGLGAVIPPVLESLCVAEVHFFAYCLAAELSMIRQVVPNHRPYPSLRYDVDHQAYFSFPQASPNQVPEPASLKR